MLLRTRALGGVAARRGPSTHRASSVLARDAQPKKQMSPEQIAAQLAALTSDVDSALGRVGTNSGGMGDSGRSRGPELVCDENGCVLVDQSMDASQSFEDLELNYMISGDGWTLGMQPSDDGKSASGALGGRTWQTSISAKELDDFVKALHAIRFTIQRMEGTPKEGSKVKWDCKYFNMEAQGAVDAFELQFTLGTGSQRVVTATWHPAIVKDLLITLDQEVPGFAMAPTQVSQSVR